VREHLPRELLGSDQLLPRDAGEFFHRVVPVDDVELCVQNHDPIAHRLHDAVVKRRAGTKRLFRPLALGDLRSEIGDRPREIGGPFPYALLELVAPPAQRLLAAVAHRGDLDC
jgi:hypothetical protein